MTRADGKHSFNVLLEPEHLSMLDALVDLLESDRSKVTRFAIKQYYLMKVKQIPTCADGQPCRVPNMHPPQQQPVGGPPG